MMKDVHNPDEADIREWVDSNVEKWPSGDWDYCVVSGCNEALILGLASDEVCPQQAFFVHALYYMIGNYFNDPRKLDRERRRIEGLLSAVDESGSPAVRKWKEETNALLNGDMEFDSEYWFNQIIHHELYSS